MIRHLGLRLPFQRAYTQYYAKLQEGEDQQSWWDKPIKRITERGFEQFYRRIQ